MRAVRANERRHIHAAQLHVAAELAGAAHAILQLAPLLGGLRCHGSEHFRIWACQADRFGALRDASKRASAGGTVCSHIIGTLERMHAGMIFTYVFDARITDRTLTHR
eukprot:COSAG05_NODE_25_length_31349_cov_4.978560_27_plen_108_part_00